MISFKEMIMNKIVSVLLCLACIVALTACGSGSEEVSGQDEQTPLAVDAGSDVSEDTPAGGDSDTEEAEGAGDEAETSDEEQEVSGDHMELVNTYFDNSKYTDDEGRLYFQSFGNHILCSLDTEKSCPGLARTLTSLADDEEKEFRDEIREYDSDAREFSDSMSVGDTAAYYSRYAEDVLKRADDRCVSILRLINGYLGGAHPDYYYKTYNISPDTGEQIKLSDVISDKESLNRILEKKLTEEYPEVDYFDLQGSLAEYDMSVIESGENPAGDFVYAYDFTLDPDGIAFYFSPYSLSAYVYGDQMVKILYEEEPSLFKTDYAYEGAYISYITETENKYGIGGTVQSVGASRSGYEEDGYYQSVDIHKGDETISIDDIYYYSTISFLSHSDKGDYMFVITNMDNDYRVFYIADLNGEAPVLIDKDEELSYTFKDYFDTDNGIYGIVLPLDPDSMEFSVRCDLLSTYNAYGEFEISDKGTLENKDVYFLIPDGCDLRSIASLQSDIVDEAGNIKERSVTIPEGEEYTLYRTDGKSIVDAKLSDGRIIRMEVSPDYPHVVNGMIDENELFETLYYAG